MGKAPVVKCLNSVERAVAIAGEDEGFVTGVVATTDRFWSETDKTDPANV